MHNLSIIGLFIIGIVVFEGFNGEIVKLHLFLMAGAIIAVLVGMIVERQKRSEISG